MDEDFVAFAPNDGISGSKYQEDPVLLTAVPAPWLQFEIQDPLDPPFVRFHNEILSFCEYIAPTSTESRCREKVFEEIRDAVARLWPSAVVHVFGSQMTRILTPTSDIDIAILGVTEEKSLTQNLFDFAAVFRSQCSYCEVISNAKVTLIQVSSLSDEVKYLLLIGSDSKI